MARKVIKGHGPTAPPIDVRAIAESERLSVRDLPVADKGWSGQLYRSENAIALNASHHEHRKRFSIAHELGHYFLNHDSEEQENHVGLYGAYLTGQLEDDDELPDMEREANEFASELLIPLAMLKKDWKERPDAKQLAARYQVSAAAMWVSVLKHGLFK